MVECRGAERFQIVAEALQDPALKAFYTDLWKTGTKHGHQFADLALQYYSADEVYQRLQELMQDEARIVENLPWRASLH